MRLRTVTFIFMVLVIWFMLASGISLYINSLWFDSVGYLSVFNTTLWSKFIFWLGGFGLSLAVLSLNFWLASRRSLGSYWFREELVALARRGSNTIFRIVIFAVSVFLGLVVQSQWLSFLQFQNRVSTGIRDPIFQKDLSFYFFTLPVMDAAISFTLALLFFSFLVAAANYVIHGHIGYFRSLQLSFSVQLHLSLLIGLGFLLMALRFWLKRYDLLYSERGVTFGAGYTDLHAQLYSYWILVVVSCLTASLFILASFARTIRLAALSAIGFILAYFVVNNAYPFLVQALIVEPNELQKERPYIEHNIRLTNQAYNLDEIEVRDFAAAGGLTLQHLLKSDTTVRNIRLWDWRPLKDNYNQLQSIRTYYEFEDVDLDRYVIDGSYRQVMLSVRELDFSKISAQAQTWVNKHFQYTHGYGLCLSPVNEVTAEGQPEFFIKDIPPRSNIDLKITRPEIYFGEKTDYPVFIRTATKEFDYPSGDKNEFTIYKADRGVAINSLPRKMLFAWELKSSDILFTQSFTRDSKVLLHRQINGRTGRIHRIAPFLHYDNDPYIVVHDGRLFWMQDAYTVTNRYPYSEPFQKRFNYIRNSVKVVVDAYLGDVTFYIADNNDPLIRAYARIFPELFKPLSAMPEGLRKHIRYPEDLFNVQRDMFRTYHMRDPTAFYNKEDLWEVPNEIYAGSEQLMESYYVIMNFPGSAREEFVLLIPFTPRNKNNMIGWLAARSDGENYGKLMLYQFPKQKLTYGPMQIEARIDQDPMISQLITLWSQKGSRVLRGNLLVIPLKESIIYVEPLYLQAEKSEIPELRRIIVTYENHVAMAETLERTLESVFVGAPPAAPSEKRAVLPGAAEKPTAKPAGSQELIARALEHYRRSQEFLRQGKWAEYGEEQRKLREVLEALSR